VNNIPEWGIEDGHQIAQMCQLQDCKLINNYQCNGYGLDQITIKDYYFLTSVEANPQGVKCIAGPGTGYGEAILYKSAFAAHHDCIPSEGGHIDFAPRSAEDIKLMEFAKNYIENSNNVENVKSNGRITRVSVERLCSGRAVPLLYEFYKSEFPDFTRVLEQGENALSPDEITSVHIMKVAMGKDPLCLKVLTKFTEILAIECGNLALKVLPFGGMFLYGGVTKGIIPFLIKDELFRKVFNDKGRFTSMMRRFPIMVIRKHVQLGLLGAEECAFRMMDRYKEDMDSQPQETEAVSDNISVSGFSCNLSAGGRGRSSVLDPSSLFLHKRPTSK